MLFGIEWDTSSDLSFAVSILPILLRGLWITLQATALGFVIALVLGWCCSCCAWCRSGSCRGP